MEKCKLWAASIGVVGATLFSLGVNAAAVNITANLEKFTVKHGGKDVTVMRVQDQKNVIAAGFAKTSRKCPPFCIQPYVPAKGVHPIGEVELIDFMLTKLKDGSGVLMDARTPDWHAKGTIPGSVNTPYKYVNRSKGANDITIEDAFEVMGVSSKGSAWDFSTAKDIVLYCNGPWCGQSPAAIHGLIDLGYPPGKLYYYRGGMQLWQSFGLTVVDPVGTGD